MTLLPTRGAVAAHLFWIHTYHTADAKRSWLAAAPVLSVFYTDDSPTITPSVCACTHTCEQQQCSIQQLGKHRRRQINPHILLHPPIHLCPILQLSSVQFHLLTTATLLLSREGFRRGCMRLGGRVSEGAAMQHAVKKRKGIWPFLPAWAWLHSMKLHRIYLCNFSQGRCLLTRSSCGVCVSLPCRQQTAVQCCVWPG